uniref:Uncharacterized protein n=1 Tax=viral metagenome TaxID=1070528 RepID=A0A6M3IRT6_9ZZZZ
MELEVRKSGSLASIKQGEQDGILVTHVSGKYVEAALAGRLFSVANQAAVTTTAALATTWTGLGVCNPTGSGKNLIIHEFGWALSVVGPDDGIVGLMSSDDTGFAAALTAKAAMNGRGASVARCDDGATIATPILERVCGTIGTGATTVQISVPQSIYQIAGSIILPPGRSIMTYTTTATTAAAVFFFLWEEVSI